MKLALTGASGYIGERLLRLAAAQGHELVALTRRRPALPVTEWIPWELGGTAPIELPPGTTALVHLAATTTPGASEGETEVRAAQLLLAAARRSGSRFIFISSQTACADAPTAYGRGKWRIEQDVLAAGGLVLRPGMVYGARERGLFGQLASTLRKLPVLPAFLPTPLVQPVHVDDLAAAILAAAAQPALPATVLCIGAAAPVSFTAFLRCLARHWLRRTRVVVPVPVLLVSLLRRLVGRLGSAGAALDRLGSLFALPVMRSAEDLARLGISLRPLPSGMARSGNGSRRALLREGRALLCYTLRAPPSASLVRRYVQAIEQLRGNAALPLPTLLLRFPALLPLVEDQRNGELCWRLQAAVALGEASPQGARRYLRLGQQTGCLRGAVLLARALAAELLWRLVRLCLWPVLLLRRNAEWPR